MQELYVIIWVAILCLSVVLNFHFVGMRLMCAFFPEGKRWWMLPVQVVTLVFFAAVVLCHPFK